MTASSLVRTPKVNLSKYVNIGGDQWRFCKVVVSANGRVRPDYVIVAGKPELHREGAYYIEWYEKGTRRRQSVGKNAIEAPQELGATRGSDSRSPRGVAGRSACPQKYERSSPVPNQRRRAELSFPRSLQEDRPPGRA